MHEHFLFRFFAILIMHNFHKTNQTIFENNKTVETSKKYVYLFFNNHPHLIFSIF